MNSPQSISFGNLPSPMGSRQFGMKSARFCFAQKSEPIFALQVDQLIFSNFSSQRITRYFNFAAKPRRIAIRLRHSYTMSSKGIIKPAPRLVSASNLRIESEHNLIIPPLLRIRSTISGVPADDEFKFTESCGTSQGRPTQ
jgi:hypothetical protein